MRLLMQPAYSQQMLQPSRCTCLQQVLPHSESTAAHMPVSACTGSTASNETVGFPPVWAHLKVLEGPLILTQHKGRSIDVDDWLLPHVVPDCAGLQASSHLRSRLLSAWALRRQRTQSCRLC